MTWRLPPMRWVHDIRRYVTSGWIRMVNMREEDMAPCPAVGESGLMRNKLAFLKLIATNHWVIYLLMSTASRLNFFETLIIIVFETNLSPRFLKSRVSTPTTGTSTWLNIYYHRHCNKYILQDKLKNV